jgi:hypothetical protein
LLYLSVAVAVVGALCVLDLLLTVGVIRRLREHTELLSSRREGMIFDVIAVGQRPGEFTWPDIDGAAVSREDVEGATLLGFFTPTCDMCKTRLPEFLAAATRFPGGRDGVLAVVAGALDDGGGPLAGAEALIAELRAVARVVLEPHDGPVSAAFNVAAYPSWVLMDGRVVGATAVGMDPLPSPSTAWR